MAGHFLPMLASAGDDIKIWNSSNYNIAHQFSTHLGTSFCSIHWSSDLQQLVSVPTSGSSLLCTLIKQQSLQHAEFDTKVPNTVAKFSSTSSRFLGIGSKCGDLLIWDCKHSKPKKALKSSSSEVTCLQFNWNDSYIASGFVDGSIVLHNVTTGQSTSPLYTPDSQAIRDLSYSYLKKSLIGCVSDDGTVALWDANTRQSYHRFSSIHTAPATSVSFSPVNSVLLTSVGLDKKIICYDTQVKKMIKSLNCDSPLTSVDFKDDGVTLAAGSSRGLIYVFDLRSHSVPVHTLSAHCSSVQSLSFQNSLVGSISKKDPPKSSYKFESDVAHEPFHLQKTKEVPSGKLKSEMSVPLHIQRTLHSHLQEVQRGSLTSEIFSPLKVITEKSEVFLKNTDPILGSHPVPFTDVLTSATSLINEAPHLAAKRGSLTDEIFSPVRANVKQNEPLPDICSTKSQNSSLGQVFSPLLNVDNFSKQGTQQPLRMCENVPSSPVLCDKTSLNDLEKTKLNQLSPVLSEASNQMGSPVQFENYFFKNADEHHESMVTVTGIDGDGVLQGNEVNEIANKSVGATFEDPEMLLAATALNISLTNAGSSVSPQNDCVAESVADEGKGTSEPVTPMAPQAFQAEFIRQIVKDAMEDCRQEMRQSFLHYFVQMIRQFQRQKEEIEELLQKYSINDELVSEIKRLKEENNHLRATF